MKLYCDTRLSLNYMYKDCEYITLWNVICQDMFFSEKLFVRNGFQFHCCRTRFQSLSPAEGQVVWDGMMHCMVWYSVLGDGMMHGCGSEMWNGCSAKEGVQSSWRLEGLWNNHREASPGKLRCGAGQDCAQQDTFIFRIPKSNPGHLSTGGKKVPLHSSLSIGVEWYRGEKGDMAIKREIESGHRLQGKS